MEFRNNLIMSLLLVGSFLCLHFYEHGVIEKYNAYDTFLGEMVLDSEISISQYEYYIEYLNRQSGDETGSYDLAAREIKDLQRLIENPSLINLVSSKRIIKKYGVNIGTLIEDGEISNLGKYEFYKGIIEDLAQLKEDAERHVVLKNEEDMHLIIRERQESYELFEEYELEFEVVNLYTDINAAEFYVETGRKKEKVDRFPVKFSEIPETYFLSGEFFNEVTGETQKHRIKFVSANNNYP